MAEERTDIPVTPEKIELERGDIRRNSTGKTDIPNRGAKILPHYLRASTSSCHDFCKYGRKHAFEAKARTPMPKRITARLGEGQDVARTVTLAERKKKPAISPKPCPDSKTQTSDKPLVIKREVSSSGKKVAVPSRQNSSAGKEVDIAAKRASTSKLKPARTKPSSLPTAGGLSSKRNNEVKVWKEVGPLPMNPPGGLSSRENRKIKISKGIGTSERGENKVLVTPTVSVSPKPSVKRVASTNARSYKNFKGVSHLKNQNDVRKSEPKQLSNENVPEKILYVIELKAENETVEPTQNSIHAAQPSPLSVEKSLECDRNGNYTRSPPSSEDKSLEHARNGVHTTRSPLSSENKNFRRTQNGIHTTRSSPSSSLSSENKSLSRTRNGSHTTRSSSSSLSSLPSSMSPSESTHNEENGSISGHDETETKISVNKNFRRTQNGIHTTRLSPSSSLSSENKSLRRTRNGSHTTRSSSSSLSSLPSSMSLSESTHNEENGSISGHDGTETKNQVANPKVEYKSRPRRGRMISSEDKDCPPRKLSFRRGKVVDLQSENNIPRRLRFRQGRVQGENQNGKADSKRRSFRRREAVDVELNGNKTKSEKVALRHQDMEGKKDAQSLFNNVIEETASKLVETRKSKVKALVSAFETVISLQDTKSSVTTKTC